MHLYLRNSRTITLFILLNYKRSSIERQSGTGEIDELVSYIFKSSEGNLFVETKQLEWGWEYRQNAFYDAHFFNERDNFISFSFISFLTIQHCIFVYYEGINGGSDVGGGSITSM